MPFNWREYLELARFLQGQGGSTFSQEAAFRCAVSRAYYAAFCYARNYARDNLTFPPKYGPEDHIYLKEYFRVRAMQFPGIALKLDSLRQKRNRCDYEDSINNPTALLQQALIEAKDVIEGLK